MKSLVQDVAVFAKDSSELADAVFVVCVAVSTFLEVWYAYISRGAEPRVGGRALALDAAELVEEELQRIVTLCAEGRRALALKAVLVAGLAPLHAAKGRHLGRSPWTPSYAFVA